MAPSLSEALLTSALIGCGPIAEYCSALITVRRELEVFVVDRPSIYTLPLRAILKTGLGSLTDEEICLLGVNRITFVLLGALVSEAMCSGFIGDFWWEKALDVGDSLPDDYLPLKPRKPPC